MALRYPSQDFRLWVGGTPVHGLTEVARTLKGFGRAATHGTFDRTAIGDPAGRNGYLRHSDTTFTVSGFCEDEYGIKPMIDRATPVGGEDDGLPATISTNGGAAGTVSTAVESSQWSSESINSPGEEDPCMIDAECDLSNARRAICMWEGRVTGGGQQGSAALSQVSRPVPIRTTGLRIQIISGARQLLLYVTEGDARRLAVGDDVQLFTGSVISQVTGTYRIVNLQQPSGGFVGVVMNTVPETPQTWSESQRNSVDSLSVLDTFTGDRAAIVHASDLTRVDAETLEVALQGRAPGVSTWNTLASERAAIPTATGGDAAFSRGFWLSVPADTRNVNAVRVLLTFLTSANVPGAAAGYSAMLRADFVPRFHHI